jgi:eukaryotic-like serine/threonine-protein kinase
MPRLDLNPQSAAALNRLLDQALDLAPADREQWIAGLPAEFAALKPRLHDLLSRAAGVETSDFLGTLPKFGAAPDTDPAADDLLQPGLAVGAYRLIRELGKGGMGSVWLAERADGLLNRQVALKLPRAAWLHEGFAERLVRERDILASLEHPNIARLYDAGVAANGRPFLALEFVEGQPLDRYCKTLDGRPAQQLAAILRLFLQAARAVAYAHGKLVLHRDLKPANILVAADGTVRLLDFGIAKLLTSGQTDETELTQYAGRALSPEYASPEQVLGEPLTVASDVYSLGVVLYGLLTGTRPYRLARATRGALEDAILHAEPERPSSVAETPVRALLRGDLDTVVLKALKKKPEDRYPTVHALLEDIERHLSRRPVLAQRDSRWYRARKFIARNKIAVSAAAAVALALIAGAVVATWQARLALTEKARAEEVQAFITSIFSEADPMMQSEGKALSAVELLLQGERRLDQRTDATPLLKVEMLAIIGESLFGLQENQEAARVIEEALRLQASLSDADSLLTARLHLALSKSREMTGDIDAALAELAKTLAALQTVRSGGPLAVRARLHESALGLATGDYAMTERAAHQAIAAATAVLGPRCDEVAIALMFLSKAYIFTERMPQAVAPARQGLEILLANHNRDYAHPKLIEFTPYYANALIHEGDFDTAANLMREIIANAERVYGVQSNIVGELTIVAVPAELERGELDTAISLARRSLAIYLHEAAPETAVHAYRARILGLTLVSVRAGDEAVRALEEAVRLSGKASDPHAGRGNLGLALAYAGRLDAADEQLRLALENTKAGTYQHMRAARHRGTALRLEDRSHEAVPWLEQSVTGFAKLRSDRGEHAVSLVELGLARLELGDLAAAEQSFTLADSELSELQQQRMTPTRADLLIGSARVRMRRGEFALALPDLQRVDAYWREGRPDSRWAGEAALWLGRAHLALGQRAEARAALDRAAKLLGHSKIPADQALMRLARITG